METRKLDFKDLDPHFGESIPAKLEALRKEQGELTPDQKKAVEEKADEARRQINEAINAVALEQAAREKTNVFDIAARYVPAVSLVKDKDNDGKRVARITLQPRQNRANAPAVDNGTNGRAKRRRETKMARKIETQK